VEGKTSDEAQTPAFPFSWPIGYFPPREEGKTSRGLEPVYDFRQAVIILSLSSAVESVKAFAFPSPRLALNLIHKYFHRIEEAEQSLPGIL
jgi:hypothetical protein